MNDITIMYQNMEKPVWVEHLHTFINSVLSHLKVNNWEFSLTLCDNKYIQEINRDYRNKDNPTDVITFVMSDEAFPAINMGDELYSAGDIIISMETVKENSNYFKVDYQEEFKRVIIHGILHLKGLDHKTNDPKEDMLILQEEVLKFHQEAGIY